MPLIRGTDDADYLEGGLTNDTLIGGRGEDDLRGGGGNDVFRYEDRGFDSDSIYDFNAGDKIDLRGLHIADFKTLKFYLGENSIYDYALLSFENGGDEIDTIAIHGVEEEELSAKDFIFDKSDADLVVKGSNFGEVLFAAKGDDRVNGRAGDDSIHAGSGDDTINGGDGRDQIYGNGGRDVFKFEREEYSADTIWDFKDGDRIDLRDFGFENFKELKSYLSWSGDDTYIRFDGGGYNYIGIKGVTPDDLDKGDFII